jgi:phosphoenolpyruvate synthase
VDVALVGGKAANLGEMTRAGLPVPPGFCVTAEAYRAFVGASGAGETISTLLAGLDPGDAIAVDAATAAIRQLLTAGPVPDEIAAEIAASYATLAGEMGGEQPLPVAVRSSATAEDLPDASFAGQQDTYLNVRGEDALLEHVRRCWASLWTARAVTYRAKQGYDHERVALAVVVQAIVAADVAGVLFTADPLTSDLQTTVINASYGLGEAIVSGTVTPDTWHVDKDTRAIRRREIGHKERQVVRLSDGGTDETDVPPHLSDAPSLSDEQVAELAGVGARIEAHYAQPMDVEWAYSGGRAYMLQARPITTLREALAEDGAVEPGDYNRTMFIEIFPDPLSPAFVSVVEPLFTGTGRR